MDKNKKFSIGLDYGTSSARAVVVDIDTGEEITSCVYAYQKGKDGILLDHTNHDVARQHPADYLQGLETCIAGVIKSAKKNKRFKPELVIGIGVDTTGSTPIPVTKNGIPLAFTKEFKTNINAMAWLWKDHSSHAEAIEITDLARAKYPQYLAKCGGTYSSEWFFSKVLHCLRVDRKVFNAAYSWVEFCDYIPAILTGDVNPSRIKRSICAAGHKAMYNDQYGGLPKKEFLAKLDPQLASLRDRLYDKAYPAGIKAGNISKKYAAKFGLPADVCISVGAFDAHMGAVGAGIKPGTLSKVIGTSSCDMMIYPKTGDLKDIPGLCGIVDSSIVPGYWGLEAGQSAVGDLLYWFVDNFTHKTMLGGEPHKMLTAKAAKLKPGQAGLLALDWNNGNRTVLVDSRLTGLIVGYTLQTKPEHVYRSLIEGTAFGAKVIIDRFQEYGVKVNEVINCGGIAEKNPLFMQIYCDVFGVDMKVSRSSQTCALGAAIFGAVSAGKTKSGYDTVEQAQQKICGIKKTYTPDKKNYAIYQKLFKLYRQLHDSFGTQSYSGTMYNVMKELLQLKTNE
jgi:L-ribulokinase